MSNFRPQRGHGYDQRGSHLNRHDHLKPAPPAIQQVSSGRPSGRYYNERRRSRSPLPFRNDPLVHDAPLRQQAPTSSSSRLSRHDEHSQRVTSSHSSSRNQDQVPQVGSSRYQDQSREAPTRRAESAKRAATSSSKKSASPHSKKPTSSSASKTTKSKSSHAHTQNTSSGQPSNTKSTRSSAPDSQSSRPNISKSTEVLVVREILNPNDVKIPRRTGEGAKPIFDRDELRESIKRRTKAGDTEQNPVAEPIEQRVVAIIREPVLIDSYAAAAASTSTSRKHSSQTESRNRGRAPSPDLFHTTTSGVPYRLNPLSPPSRGTRRSLSPILQPIGRERERLDLLDRRRDNRDLFHDSAFSGASSRSHIDRGRRDRSKSRSRSPVDRVRRVTLNSSSTMPLEAFGRRSNERDLRESLNRGLKADPMAPVPRDVSPRGLGRGRGFVRGGFARRPRGGFVSRGRVFTRRGESRWEHDKFDRSGADLANPN